jgi:hypothetical protein
MEAEDLLIIVVCAAALVLAVFASAGLICLLDWLTQPKKYKLSGGFLLLVLVSARAAAEPNTPDRAVDFNRDIRPILSDNCFKCHGPDAKTRKAGLRLDSRTGALAELRSGGFAVVPGRRSASEVWNRIATRDDTERMPPRSTEKRLTPAQIELVGRWIDQGAPWVEHWAYTRPRRPVVPTVARRSWPRNPIDNFVLHRLEHEGLVPAPEADRATLLRRLSLDLLGLPPTPAQIDAFVKDPSPNAYENVVDRLLASPRYGERMAQPWLDLARYADTNGYRLDNHRDMWKWRDWVIYALNRNMPFDEFTVEQLAGDLLPRATVNQKVATGFHRNTMVNFGNGSDPKEYLHKAVSDRVATTATVWLGTTMVCAQCHDHKYDPFTQKDYYRLYAFFNNVPEKGLDGEKANPVPSLMLPTPEQERKLAELRRARQRLGPRDPSDGLQKAEEALLASIPSTLVMEEMPRPRPTHVLIRGDYLSPGERVTAGVPASLPGLPEGAPANRLGLARWLTDPGHPLTARVAVNRAWQTFFGTGIVKTADDFGSQGDPPSHPALLDWLAAEFCACGWDVKRLHKLIVMSATYRQTSDISRELREKDPGNRLLARGPRFRLDAETIRDNALAVSGLLDQRIGGPSVRPHQPAGLWEQVAVGGSYSSQTYVPSVGRDLYRRGLYTYVKRSMPHPSLTAFDAPNREACTVSRPRTTTPLQALVLLNDPAYLEAGRALAQRVLRNKELDTRGRLAFAFQLCTGRRPQPGELDVLARVLDQQLRGFRHERQAARDLGAVGAEPILAETDATDLAAWTVVGSLLLNLDETLTRS